MFGASSIHFHFYSGMFSFLSVFNNGIMTQQDQDSVFRPRSNLDFPSVGKVPHFLVLRLVKSGSTERIYGSGIFRFSIVY